jgi:hypothetical protein
MGLKIDKIASKNPKSSSQIQAVTSDRPDDLLQHQHSTDRGQEELSINFDYDNTEKGSLTDTDEEETRATPLGHMFFSKDATKNSCYNYSRSSQSKKGPHGNKTNYLKIEELAVYDNSTAAQNTSNLCGKLSKDALRIANKKLTKGA